MQRGRFLQDTPRGSSTSPFSFMMYHSNVSLTMTQANNRFVLGSTARVFSWTKTKQSFQRTVIGLSLARASAGMFQRPQCLVYHSRSHPIKFLNPICFMTSYSFFCALPSFLFAPSPSSLVEPERRLLLNHSQEAECVFFQHVFVKPVLQTRKALLAAHCCW